MTGVLLALAAALLIAGAGLVLGVKGVRRSPSALPTASAMLQGEENLSQALLDNLSDAVIACDARGRRVLFNRTARHWLGLPEAPPEDQAQAEEWSARYGLYAADGITPLSQDNLPLSRALRGEPVRNIEMAIAPPGRRARFVLCDGNTVLDRAGNKIGAVLVMHDVTEQREAGQQRLLMLDRIQRQQETVLRISNDAQLSEMSLPDAARLITEASVKTLGVGSCSVWLFSPDRQQLRCVDRYDAARRAHDGDIVLELDEHPRYFRALQTSHAIDAYDACVDPRVSESAEKYFKPRGVGATLDASIRLQGEVVGAICNEHMGAPRRWTQDECTFAAAMAEQVAQCLVTQERLKTAETLRDSEQRFRALYDENPAMFFTVDAENHIVSANQFGASQLGYHVAELVGQPFTTIVAEPERAAALLRHANCLNAPPAGIHRWETGQLGRDGSILQVRQTARRVQAVDGRPQVLYVCEDVTETHRLTEKLAYEASHDLLTGLFNRWEFQRQLRHALGDAQNMKREHALLYIDIDQIKVINENSGHAAGDQLLRQVGGLLGAQLPDESGRAILARLGGDEFAVLLRDCDITRATQVAESMRHSLSQLRFGWQEQRFRISASFGVVTVNAASENVEAVLQAADAACYLAKDQGRNRVHIYQPDDAVLARRRNELQWAARIRSALEENRLRLVRHTIMPLKTPTRGHHYELLLRLIDEQGQLTSDAHFLSAAEHYGFAPLIDSWVVNNALDWLTKNPEHLRQLHLCCINLSGLSLGQEEFLEMLKRRLREGGVPPSKICFEITETAAVANLSRATEFMRTLRGMGCSFSLDDFGSGLSSYAYLRDLEVDYLKIDGSFVRRIADDPVDLALLRSMNEIGQLLGKKTIAEFAENERVIAKLREVGVDYIQGHGVSKPEPMDAPMSGATASQNRR